MAEELPQDAEVDPFLESDEWLAAQVRLLFSADRAGDAKAVEVARFYLEHFLTLTVRRHIGQRDPVWDGSQRWFDGLFAEPEYPSPGRLRLCGKVCWVFEQSHWYYDPFDFEMELCPKTGAFRRYVVRFGDHRPLADKLDGSRVPSVPVGGWAFTIERHRAELAATSDALASSTSVARSPVGG